MQSTKTLLLKPLSWTLGVGSRAAPSLEATLPTMSMKAAADMAALETPDGATLVWDTDNEPEIEIAEARIFTQRDLPPSPPAASRL